MIKADFPTSPDGKPKEIPYLDAEVFYHACVMSEVRSQRVRSKTLVGDEFHD